MRAELLLVAALLAVVSLPWAHGQTAPGLLLDAYYPGMNAGADAVDIPASASSAFIFEIHSTATSSAGANPQPLQTYTRGFPVVGCNVNGIWNISFAQLYTPEQSTDFAVHLSNRIPFPNNVTGSSNSTDQSIFSVAADTWLNLRTGVVSGLNTTETGTALYSFDPSLDGQFAGVNSGGQVVGARQVHYISPDVFYGASSGSSTESGVTHYLYPYPGTDSISPNDTGAKLSIEYNWLQGAESLLFWGGFIATQASRAEPCTSLNEGFFELAPLLAYLTTALQDSVVNFGLNYTEAGQQGVGNLYTGYVQNIVDGLPPADEVTAAPTSNVSTGVFASLTNQPILGGAFLPVDQLISDPALGLTESQCLVLAKNHTLAVSNAKRTAPANVWNFCATGFCNYTFANGTTGVLVSPYAGSHTASVCQLGYSSAVDNNEYLEAAVIQAPGQGNAGRFNPVRPLIVPGPTGIIQTTNSAFVGSSLSQPDTSTGVPASVGASNAHK